MVTIDQRFEVSYHYPVHFVENLLNPEMDLLARTFRPDEKGPRPSVLVVVDQGVLNAHPDLIDQLTAYQRAWETRFQWAGEIIPIPGGEEAKSDPVWLQLVMDRLEAEGIDRHSYLCAIGGGAVMDMAGYAAGVTHRGVRMVRIPTTVLAQNDAAVGVKSGVNAYGKKNFLGTFGTPHAVLNDFQFLSTLSDRDWRSGISEAIKVALIRDRAFFVELEAMATRLAERDLGAMKSLVIQCARLHLNHIATSGDPFETGSARPLDFGHWSAHKLEQLSGYRIRHGEAVASGIALDVIYSRLEGRIDRALEERVLRLFTACGFNLWYEEMQPDGDHWPLYQGLEEFREHLGGELTITLLRGEGVGEEVHRVDEAIYREAAEVLQQWTLEQASV